jgi:uncharacterized protein YfaS (alpha-2-macroglobulin family)
MHYLRKYPYGCTEQIISKGIPSVVLGDYKEYASSKKKVAAQVQGISELLAARQMPDGGFIKWPGDSAQNAFHSIYAAHYLTEAKDRGYLIPRNLMEHVLNYIKEYSEREPSGLNMARIQAYGAYVLSRNGIIVTKSLTEIEKWLDGYKDKSWVKDIMLLYMASAYKLMKVDEKATKLLERFDDASKMPSDYKYGVFDDTIKKAMHLYLISSHFPDRLSEFKGEKLNILVESLSNSFNTTSSALSILAFEAYARNVSPGPGGNMSVKQVIGNEKILLELKGDLFPKSLFDPDASQLIIDNGTNSFTYYSLTQAGFDLKPSLESDVSGIEVYREYVNENGESVRNVKIGDEITVRLKARVTKRDWAFNVAMIDLLPGGFEVVLDSITRRSGHIEYVDAREDRVLAFANLGKNVDVYEYRIKAVNQGTYQVPPIYAESMYDRTLHSKGKTQKIVVE